MTYNLLIIRDRKKYLDIEELRFKIQNLSLLNIYNSIDNYQTQISDYIEDLHSDYEKIKKVNI